MKTLILIRLKQFLAATLFAAALAAVTSYAGLNVPYTVDVDTLHLYHFDGPTNTITSTDDVVAAAITLTNFEQSVTPGSRITLGNLAAIAQLGTCIRIAPTNLSAGNAFAFAVNGTFWPDTTTFRNSTSGAFTLEALVRCDGNPNLAGNGNWEIIAGDNSPGGGQSRGWQFRIQAGTTPQLDFNFITGGGGNFLVNLPKSGPNILLAGIWYHTAVTYTGNAPTNGDPAGILSFYWTVLDGGRTNASVLTNITTAGTFTLGGTPVLGIGGSARNMAASPPTIANGEGFKGAIDEVRISDICRRSNEMAFGAGVTPTPPAFLLQPPTNTLVGYGQPLTLPALATSAPTFYWYHAGTNLPGQSDSTLFIPNTTFADGGDYQLVASNSVSSVTSVVAHVTIGANPSELFNTGIAADGTLAAANATDLHYVLTFSSDPNHLAPATTVWDMNAYPIAASGGNFSNPDGNSQWLGPQANNYISPVGPYTYRTTFVLDTVNTASPITVSGVWYVNEFGSDMLINGQSTSNALSAAASSSGKFPANFVITNGFVPGLNTLDFITTRSAAANGSYQESALRVSISGLGQARPAGIPTVNNQPANVTVRENGHATFSVVALGRPPLSYQWYADGTLITGATNRTLALDPVFTGGQGTNFTVVIRNDSGSVTSAPAAVLTLTTNRPPVPPPTFHVTIYSNQVANVSIASIIYGSTDADNDPISLLSFDSISTNNGTIVQNGINLAYTAPADYTGPDQYSYQINDTIDSSQGLVQITVLPLLAPTVTSVNKAGSNIVFSGGGGAAGGGYTVLTVTNLLTPLTNWTVLTTGTFNVSGNFSVTNAITPGPSQRYYILQVP